MSSAIAPTRGNSATIVRDACLFTGAAFCLLAVIAGPLAVIIGPAAAWLLHGRRLDRAAMLSGGIGLAIAIIVVGGLLVLASLVASAIGPVGGWDFAGPVALLAIVSAVFLAVVVRLDIDSIRDLFTARRQHIRLDIARLVSTLIVALFVAVVTLVQAAHPATEIGDAGVFALGAAAVGAVTMAVMQAIHARWEKRSGQ